MSHIMPATSRATHPEGADLARNVRRLRSIWRGGHTLFGTGD
jgi:hypothetical protein